MEDVTVVHRLEIVVREKDKMVNALRGNVLGDIDTVSAIWYKEAINMVVYFLLINIG